MIGFPIVAVNTIFNEFKGKLQLEKLELVRENIELWNPPRLNTMLLDLPQVAPSERMIHPAGEVLISINQPIKVKVYYLGSDSGELKIGASTKRKALVKHAYFIMSHVLNKYPSLYINVDDNGVMKHCGFGSSGTTVGAVCCAINELYGNPIKDLDLLLYIASNYGEEVEDDNEDYIQSVQALGGSISSGLFKGGIQVIAGEAVPIMTCDYSGNVVLGVPKDYDPRTAKEQIEMEMKYIYNNRSIADTNAVATREYSEKVAYKMLNQALPLLRKGDISGISDLAFDFNFNQGGISIFTCMFPRVNEIADKVRFLYEHKKCDALGKSSVGPAFYAVTTNEDDERECIEAFQKQNMYTYTIPICNDKYKIVESSSGGRM